MLFAFGFKHVFSKQFKFQVKTQPSWPTHWIIILNELDIVSLSYHNNIQLYKSHSTIMCWNPFHPLSHHIPCLENHQINMKFRNNPSHSFQWNPIESHPIPLGKSPRKSPRKSHERLILGSSAPDHGIYLPAHSCPRSRRWLACASAHRPRGLAGFWGPGDLGTWTMGLTCRPGWGPPVMVVGL